MKAVTFFNWTKEDFSHMWDGESYLFKAGSQTTMPEWKAKHFAKHAAVRELNELKGNEGLVNPQNMPPMIAKFLVKSNVEAPSKEKLEMAIMNEEPKEVESNIDTPWCEGCDSKGGRHKKDCTLDVEEVPAEDAFEGLKE